MERRLQIFATPLKGLNLVQRRPIGDSRGFLERVYCATELDSVLPGIAICAANVTRTECRGTVRGLHFQHPPHGEDKLVSCIRGSVFDVAVDLRRHSPTFLRWHAQELSEQNRMSMLIPKGFAHGFQTLSNGCEMLYFHTAPYHPESEGGIDATDPLLGIPWPETITERSARDLTHHPIDASFEGLES